MYTVNEKIGCFTKVSDFDFKVGEGLPRFEWEKNYAVFPVILESPAQDYLVHKIQCPCCNREIRIEVISQFAFDKRWKKGNLYTIGAILFTITLWVSLIITYQFD